MTEQSQSHNHLKTSEDMDKAGSRLTPPRSGEVFDEESRRWKKPPGMEGAPKDMKAVAPGSSGFALQRLHAQLTGEFVVHGLNTLSRSLNLSMTIPVEQLKGDLARAGHTVKHLMAIDVDSRRIFFTNSKGESLYAEYAPDNYAIKHVGYQSVVAKEYDVVDLESEPRSSVVTTHMEEDADDTPGFVPAGNPGTLNEAHEQLGIEEALEKSREKVDTMISMLAR